MNGLELSLYTLNPIIAVLAVFLGLFVLGLSLWMLGWQVAVKAGWTKTAQGFRYNARLLNLAYGRPKLLRVSQSPVWQGVAFLALGLGLAHWSVLRVSPAAHVEALSQGEYQTFLKDGGSADRFKALESSQAVWLEIPSDDAIWNPFPRWQADPARSDAENGIRAARLVAVSRVWFWVGVLLASMGGLVALVQSLREQQGPRDHGRAALAARKEIIYDQSGYYTFPLQVSQRGKRNYGQVGNAPFTVARPPAGTCAVHILGIGNSGSGKGAYLGGHIFATATVPLIYFDYKGEMPAYRLRPQMLRWGFPGERPKGLPSLRFNFVDWVLQHEDPDTAAKALAGSILPANSQKETDNQWIKDTAIPVLAQGILSRRWSNLAELADEIEHTPLSELLDNIETGRGRASAFEGKNVPNYAQNEISNNTQALLSGRARHIVTATDFTMDEAFSKGLYIMAQAGNVYEQRLLKVFWGVFWFELLRKGTKLPLCVFIDEGVAAGPIPMVLQALVTLRDRGVSLIQFFQFRSGIVDVYGRDKADAVIDGHQTKIYLTKGLADGDITKLSEQSKGFTVTVKDRAEKRQLLEEAELKAHARQEKYWCVIDGVHWTRSGHPILASMVAITPEGWNWRAPDSVYSAELERLYYGLEYRSAYKMQVAGIVEQNDKKYRHWEPVYREEATLRGVQDKFVQLRNDDGLSLQLLGATLAASPSEPSELSALPPEMEEELPPDFF